MLAPLDFVRIPGPASAGMAGWTGSVAGVPVYLAGVKE